MPRVWGCCAIASVSLVACAYSPGDSSRVQVRSGGSGAAAGTPPVGGSNGGSVSSAGGALGAGGTTPIGEGGVAGNGGSATSGSGGSPERDATAGGSGGSPDRDATGGRGGTAAGSGGSMSDDSGVGADGQAEKPPCLSNQREIILMGDSYVNWVSHTFPTDMNQVSGMNIENFAIGGTSMGSGGLGLIAPQFDTALATHPKISAVILDGGGNDVLVPDVLQFPRGGECKMLGAQSPTIPDCQKIVDKALEAGRKLFFHMADKGVKDVVFFFYPRVPTGTPIGGTDPNGMLDYALPKIEAECNSAYQLSVQKNPQKPLRCHFVNMVPVFQGHPEYFAAGDIHPNPSGSKAMAEALWAKMKQNCIAQPVSSGCCAPQ